MPEEMHGIVKIFYKVQNTMREQYQLIFIRRLQDCCCLLLKNLTVTHNLKSCMYRNLLEINLTIKFYIVNVEMWLEKDQQLINR